MRVCDMVLGTGPVWNTTEKNTFLHCEPESPARTPRSSSCPRSWKLQSNVSTTTSVNGGHVETASLEVVSDSDHEESNWNDQQHNQRSQTRESVEPKASIPHHQVAHMPSLACQRYSSAESWLNAGVDDVLDDALASQEVLAIIFAAHRALLSSHVIASAAVRSGQMGGVTGILADVQGSLQRGRRALTSAKEALLAECDASSTVYLVESPPFRDYGDIGFRTCLGHLPPSRKHEWHTPSKSDTMYLVVRLREKVGSRC